MSKYNYVLYEIFGLFFLIGMLIATYTGIGEIVKKRDYRKCKAQEKRKE